MFSEINLKSLFGGVFSYIPFLYKLWDFSRPTGNAQSAKYTKSIWDYHYRNYKKFSENNSKLNVVAEFGTGASIGTLISALKDNIKNVIGLDVIPYADNYKVNKKILDQLIPFDKDPVLYENIKREILKIAENYSSKRIKYYAPWKEDNFKLKESIDFIFSHSVLEHVVDPHLAYKKMFFILKEGGLMSHKIDHSSHKLTKSWNGHYSLNKFSWKLLKGAKPYLINRLTPSDHKKLILSCGFEILYEEYTRADYLKNNNPKYLDEDHLIKTSLFILKK